jgi:hypothetical protein
VVEGCVINQRIPRVFGSFTLSKNDPPDSEAITLKTLNFFLEFTGDVLDGFEGWSYKPVHIVQLYGCLL